jgi:pyrroline-5-carboxylate reductase
LRTFGEGDRVIEQAIGFIGAGQMARALAGGFVNAGLTEAGRVTATDTAESAREQFSVQVSGAGLLPDNPALVDSADIVVLAVKPQHVRSVADELAGPLPPDKLLVSIAAGVPLKRLCADFRTNRVIRVMPNTPCLIGCGASAYALGSGASSKDGDVVKTLMGAVGIAFQVEEPLLDAVTGLSGSGPAYVYMVIEALSDGGVRMGLTRAVATALAAQTVLGAAQMVVSTGEHPALLKDRVASPGGTTIAGIQALENHGLRAALISGVEAATRRSQELAGN